VTYETGDRVEGLDWSHRAKWNDRIKLRGTITEVVWLLPALAGEVRYRVLWDGAGVPTTRDFDSIRLLDAVERLAELGDV